eukprot:UN06727
MIENELERSLNASLREKKINFYFAGFFITNSSIDVAELRRAVCDKYYAGTCEITVVELFGSTKQVDYYVDSESLDHLQTSEPYLREAMASAVSQNT